MRVIRVDEEIYRKVIVEKHRLEKKRGRRVSMSMALRSLLARLKFGELAEEPEADRGVG